MRMGVRAYAPTLPIPHGMNTAPIRASFVIPYLAPYPQRGELCFGRTVNYAIGA